MPTVSVEVHAAEPIHVLDSPEEAREMLGDLQDLPLRTVATADLCPMALQLSQRQGATLLSADAQLVAAAGRCGSAPPISPMSS